MIGGAVDKAILRQKEMCECELESILCKGNPSD